MNITREAELLAQKEDWCRQVAGVISGQRNISYATALSAARWASMWLDDFKRALELKPAVDADDVKAAMKASEASSLLRADGIERYPTGIPAIRVIIAAREAFLMAFDAQERAEVRKIINANQSEA